MSRIPNQEAPRGVVLVSDYRAEAPRSDVEELEIGFPESCAGMQAAEDEPRGCGFEALGGLEGREDGNLEDEQPVLYGVVHEDSAELGMCRFSGNKRRNLAVVDEMEHGEFLVKTQGRGQRWGFEEDVEEGLELLRRV